MDRQSIDAIKVGDLVDVQKDMTYCPYDLVGAEVEKNDHRDIPICVRNNVTGGLNWVKPSNILKVYPKEVLFQETIKPSEETLLTESLKGEESMATKSVVVTQKTVAPSGLQVTEEIIFESKRMRVPDDRAAAFMAGRSEEHV